MLSRMRKIHKIPLEAININKQVSELEEAVNSLNRVRRLLKKNLLFNQQTLRVGEEVEYKSKYWTIEKFSVSKTHAKLTALNKQPVLADLSYINYNENEINLKK